MLSRIAWARTLLIVLAIVLGFTDDLFGFTWPLRLPLILLALGVVLVFVRGKGSDRAPTLVRSPVSGRWVPVNSPADRVPSHGTHELGQTYAIDLVYVPDPDAVWKSMVRSPIASRPETFPAFGQPIAAPADGVVVEASGRQRDHWSRNSWPALLYLLVEGMLFRGLLSLFTFSAGRFVLGNHVVLDLGDGVHAVFAHLRRGSLQVKKGDRVKAGDRLGEVGNSGNSSEPHLHFHLMDGPRHLTASGIPFAIEYEQDGRRHQGVPGGQRPFTTVHDSTVHTVHAS